MECTGSHLRGRRARGCAACLCRGIGTVPKGETEFWQVLTGQDPIVWANLGYLYLRLDDNDLANQCFLKSQIIDPDYAQAWLGQGLIAERNGDKEHAKALFAHSVTLSAGSLVSGPITVVG